MNNNRKYFTKWLEKQEATNKSRLSKSTISNYCTTIFNNSCLKKADRKYNGISPCNMDLVELGSVLRVTKMSKYQEVFRIANRHSLRAALRYYIPFRVMIDGGKEVKEEVGELLSNYSSDVLQEDLVTEVKAIKVATAKIPRSAKTRKIALERDGCCTFKGRFGSEHPTFINKSGTEYWEVHHVIPLNNQFNEAFQLDGKYMNLDKEWNVITLCSNCHRKVHNSNQDALKAINDYLFELVSDRNKNLSIKKELFMELIK